MSIHSSRGRRRPAPNPLYAMLGARKSRVLAAAIVVLVLAAGQALGLLPEPGQTAKAVLTQESGMLTGTVVKVADGDTVTLVDNNGQKHKIRLLGIDAPETQQAHGKAAKEWLTRKVLNKTIQVLVVETDRYQRRVGKLLEQSPNCLQEPCPFDIDINLLLVEQGHAWWYEAYKNNQPVPDRATYAQAQQQARNARLGLWGRPAPVAPWEWRKAQRESK